MESKVKVSGCIVTFNNKEEIKECVSSVLEYTVGVDFQLFISDNLSSDGTADYIKNNFSNVKVLENSENKGFGAGHDAVIPMLDSKYHVIINPDITLDKDVITELCEYMDKHEDIGMIVPKVLYKDGKEQHLPKLSPSLKYLLGGRISFLKKYRDEYTMANEKIDKPIDVDFCSGCFSVIRTDLFKQIGGFDDRYFMYFEDADLTKEVQHKGYKTMFYPNIYVYHGWSRASMHSFKFLKIQVESMFKYFSKWKFKKK